MSYLSQCMDEFFASSKTLAYSTENHVRKFVAYIEGLGGIKADSLKSIVREDVEECVGYYHRRGSICSVNSLDNHLNALKGFYTFLDKNYMGDNIFHLIKDWNVFRQTMIDRHNLIEARSKDYLLNEDICNLLEYFDSYPDEHLVLLYYYAGIAIAVSKVLLEMTKPEPCNIFRAILLIVVTKFRTKFQKEGDEPGGAS